MNREQWRIGVGWSVNLQRVDLTLRIVPGVENNDERIAGLIHYIQTTVSEILRSASVAVVV